MALVLLQVIQRIPLATVTDAYSVAVRVLVLKNTAVLVVFAGSSDEAAACDQSYA